MNLLSVLHVERACNLKKEIQHLFSQLATKKEVISILLTGMSSVLPGAATVSLNLQIRLLKFRRRELMDDTLFRLFPR